MQGLTPSLLLLAGLMTAIPAWAQPGRFYDPKNVVTVQGQVETVETMNRPGRRGREGQPGRQTQVVHLKTAQGTVRVHLGPASFLEKQQLAPKVGDAMTVTGSKLTTGQGEVILASQVQAGGKTTTLRDAQGIPVWRGKGGGRQRFFSPSPPGPSPTPPQ